MKNKKRYISLFLLLVVGISILIYQHQKDTVNADTVKVIIGHSNQFNKREINEAVITVKENFNIKGCKLTKIWYSEKENEESTDSGGDYEMVLLSNFKVDSSGSDGFYEPNSTQTNYSWILVRDSIKGKWRIKNQGYN
ncbi:hypothetical protein [Bacillus sp. UNCCL81]|uniref:hypothetical protein n=1 Tax=Bacillus sp. UNCCL81 TaxID=1502755 RepID=UPI000471C856|nr:hypothetical protein [Bacillus sp. UNCCL81]SFD61155.1 hypothetical protein SAMN02799633_04279 [Bacillus sp. UNCCL81]